MSFLVIGDEIHYDGHLVGMLAQAGVPATVMDDVIERLECATMPEEVEEPEPEVVEVEVSSPDDYDQALEDLEILCDTNAKNGLLRMSDLRRFIAQLKEETS